VLFVEGLGNEALARRRMEAMRILVGALTLEATAATEPATSPDPVIELSATILVGDMAELMIRWVQGELDVEIDRLIEDVAALFLAMGEAAGTIIATR
jgi:hypothetical protein